MKRGQIYLANLNPGKGSEPGKTRPVLIVQDQALIDVEHPSTLIIPLTTQLVEDAEPLRLHLAAKGKLNKTSDLLIDQLRAIDNRRLIGEALMQCPDQFMQRVDQCMQAVLGIQTTEYLI